MIKKHDNAMESEISQRTFYKLSGRLTICVVAVENCLLQTLQPSIGKIPSVKVGRQIQQNRKGKNTKIWMMSEHATFAPEQRTHFAQKLLGRTCRLSFVNHPRLAVV